MKNIILLFFVCYTSFSYGKKLDTIYDSGNTLSIEKYYGSQNIPGNHQPAIDPKNLSKALSFPVHTGNMSPGEFKPIDKHIPHLQIPLFLIGDDDFSRQWLLKRKHELIRLNAVGMLVEVADMNSVQEIMDLASELKIYPASGNDIAEQLHIKHYPVLISRFGIEQ